MMKQFTRRAGLRALNTQVALASTFSDVKMGPADPILGLSSAFQADKDPRKVNLGVGVYRGDDGKPFLLEAVKEAEKKVIGMDHEYAPITGVPTFVTKAQKLAFGDDSPVLKEKRAASGQMLSGTGALRIAAEMMARFSPNKTIYVPNPSWANHLNVFRDAGLKIERFTYYDPKKGEVAFDNMMNELAKAEPGSMVLWHACAHNPTGMDPTPAQWVEIAKLMKDRNLFPFIDMAYQGFASGCTDTDAFALRHFAENCPNLLVCQSFAKSFGLYGQRCGALHLVTSSEDETSRVLSQLKILIRPMYSNPPLFGARVVDTILDCPDLTEQWKTELKHMASRMDTVRKTLVQELKDQGSEKEWGFITKQIGMMAYTGLNKDQVAQLKADHHIYMTDDGRAAISGLNSTNVKYVAQAFHDVSK